MTNRDTLRPDGGKVYPRRRFTGGHAVLAILAAAITLFASTCTNTPDDYSRLRSQGAAPTERITTP